MNPVAEGYGGCYSEPVAATDDVGQTKRAKKELAKFLKA